MLILVLNGLVYGSLLYVLSVGLVLIFGLRRVTNFAHGGLYMVGAYLGYAASTLWGFWGGLVASIFGLALLGIALDRLIFRPLQNHDPISTILVTFGLLLVLEDGVRTLFGKDFILMQPPPLLNGVVKMLGSPFPIYRLFIIAVAIVVAAGLATWLRRSRVGLFVRAASVDPVTTGIQGVDTERLSLLVVAIGTSLAGLAGVVSAPLLALSPSMGGFILIECFVVVVTGGLSSFTGAFVAAMLIGQAHNLGVAYFPALASLIPLLVMSAVLIARPEGLVKAGR
ncbi:MAG: branched-chain amino acid ABC transporter permease [Rhodoblastus sp.]|mgnify:CR=1 FL=1